MAKTIKELAEKILEENKDEIVSIYDRYAGIIDGANAVLEEIETYLNNLNLGNSTEEKFYKLDVIADVGLYIKQLKGE